VIRTSYRPEADAMFVWFGPDGSKSAGTEEVAAAIMLDFDEHEHGVGIEVLDVAERLTRPQAAAEQISPEGAADFAPIFECMLLARDDLERDLAVAGDGLGDREWNRCRVREPGQNMVGGVVQQRRGQCDSAAARPSCAATA